MLGEQIADAVRWLEMQRQHAAGSEDAEQHLHPVADLLCPIEMRSHPALDPHGSCPVPLGVASMSHRSAFRFACCNTLRPTLELGECGSSRCCVLYLEGGDDTEQHAA